VNKPILHTGSFRTNTFCIKIDIGIKNLQNFFEIYHKKITWSAVRKCGTAISVFGAKVRGAEPASRYECPPLMWPLVTEVEFYRRRSRVVSKISDSAHLFVSAMKKEVQSKSVE